VRFSFSLEYLIDIRANIFAFHLTYIAVTAEKRKAEALAIFKKNMMARLVQFLIESVYDTLHGTRHRSAWNQTEILQMEKEAVRRFYLECKDNGHSEYCKNYKPGISVPSVYGIANFLRQCGTKGSPNLTPELSRFIKTEKWLDIHHYLDSVANTSYSTIADSKGPTQILKALWKLSEERKRDIVANP
jgi:hypothetical protein